MKWIAMGSELGEKIDQSKAVIGVIGLGYIGLSLLDVFGKAGFSLRGYDKDPDRINSLLNHQNPTNYLDLDNLFHLMEIDSFKISSEDNILENCDVLIICVPTTLDEYHIPDLSCLRKAFQTVYKYSKSHQLIVLQSSTYPGSTEEELFPLLDNKDLTVGKDYFLAHVPEVADIGNPKFEFADVPRIVSGVTPSCLKMVEKLYIKIGCQIVPCSSPKVAESAKLLQNTFRLINISFINEMKIMFDHMGIDIWEVIKVASSKPFGFVPFYPGPGIGGDCIPIDPFYLMWKAQLTNGPTTLIEQAGHINESMPGYVVNKTIQALSTQNKSISGSKLLFLGVCYKEDVNDIRASPSLKVIATAMNMGADVFFHDPYVDEIENLPQFPDINLKSIEFDYDDLSNYDAVVVLVSHYFYEWDKILDNSKLIIDTKNISNSYQGDHSKIIKA
jgi:UDP-N-acetyl-D-glucosamine dehydrogenase